MDTVKIKKVSYYKLVDIKSEHPTFANARQSTGNIIENHKLDEGDYTYARLKDSKWCKSDGTGRRVDKLFISQEWFDKNFEKDVVDDIVVDDIEVDDIEIDDINLAPNVIKLKKSEKFYNNNDEIIEIEVRGERNIDECFLRYMMCLKDLVYLNCKIRLLIPEDHTKKNFIINIFMLIP